MARKPVVLDDLTPLDGSQIDVASRIGWLLRCSRSAAGLDLRTMAGRLTDGGVPISAASLSRLETEGSRVGTVIDGYEQVLGIESGRLRGTVDAVCRTFAYAPRDESPTGEPLDLAGFDDLVEAVSGSAVTAGDWLRFAREHEAPRGYGLTGPLLRPLVRRLASEMSRSVGAAFVIRYEALARLRCSAYADVVEDVVRELVLAPDAQVVFDLFSAVSELPTVELLTWAGELLSHDDLMLVRGGDILVQNMRSVGGGLTDEAWAALEEPFLAACHRASGDQPRRVVLTRLFKNLPPATRRGILERMSGPFEPVSGPRDWTKTRRNVHFGLASEVASRACSAAGLPEEPLLARLVFEVLYDFRGPRSTCAAFLVLASPFADAVHRQVCEVAATAEDAPTKEGARRAASILQTRTARPVLDGWLSSPDVELVRTAHVLSGHSGQLLPDEQLEASLAGDAQTVSRVLYAAGMAGDPRLPAISVDRRRPAAVRAAAGYWVREGARVIR